MRAFRVTCACLTVTALLLTSTATNARGVHFEHYRLENGLGVILSEDHSAPIVSVEVWFDVGSKHEEPGRTGLAHLTEHMMFQGSDNVGPREHTELIAAVGGRAFGTTIEDHNRFYQTVPSHRYNLALWLEAERMRSLDLSDDRIEIQRAAVRGEKLERIDTQPYQRGFWRSRTLPYEAGECFAYAHHVMGDMEELEGIAIEDIRRFYDHHYRPANATIVVVGDFVTEEAKALIERYFGGIPGGRDVGPPDCTLDFSPGIRVETIHDPHAPTAAVFWSYRVPPARKEEDRLATALSRLLISGGYLRDRLVGNGGPATQVTGWHDRRSGPGLLWFQAIGREGVSAQELAEAIQAAMAGVPENLPSPDDFARTRARLQTWRSLQRRTVQWKSETLGRAWVLGTLDRWRQPEVESGLPSRADVVEFARRTVRPANLSMVLVTPEPEQPGQVGGFLTNPPPALGDARAVALEPYRHGLPNGLRLVVVEDHEEPVFIARLYADAGGTRAATMPVLGRILDEGTGLRDPESLRSWLGERGALYESGEIDGLVTLAFTAPSEFRADGVRLLSEAARNPPISEETVLSARKAAARSARSELASPETLASAVATFLAAGRPGARAIPDPARVEMTDVGEVTSALERTLAPDRSILLLAGDIDRDTAVDLVEDAFGEWKLDSTNPGTAALVSTAPAPVVPGRIVLIDRPGVTQAVLRVASRVAAEETRQPALQVLSQVLGTGGTGRLFDRLREEKGWTYGARTRLDPAGNVFMVETTVTTDVVHDALTETLRVLDNIRRVAVPADELDRARGYLISAFALDNETPEQLGEELVLSLVRRGETRFEEYASRIEAVTPDHVLSAAATVLDPARRVLVVAGDADALEPALSRSWPVQTVRIEDGDIESALERAGLR